MIKFACMLSIWHTFCNFDIYKCFCPSITIHPSVIKFTGLGENNIAIDFRTFGMTTLCFLTCLDEQRLKELLQYESVVYWKEGFFSRCVLITMPLVSYLIKKALANAPVLRVVWWNWLWCLCNKWYFFLRIWIRLASIAMNLIHLQPCLEARLLHRIEHPRLVARTSGHSMRSISVSRSTSSALNRTSRLQRLGVTPRHSISVSESPSSASNGTSMSHGQTVTRHQPNGRNIKLALLFVSFSLFRYCDQVSV